MSGRRIVVAAVLGAVAAGCGNFFPNPGNVVLPSGARTFDLVCGTVPRGQCELRVDRLAEKARVEHPGVRVTKIELRGDGGYTISFSDGNSESLIVN